MERASLVPRFPAVAHPKEREAPDGGSLYPVSDKSWQEKTITWNNQPAAGSTAVASLRAVSGEHVVRGRPDGRW